MPDLLKEFLVIAALVALGSSYSLVSGLAPAPWEEPEFEPGAIRYEDAAALDVIWLDARSAEDYAKGHIEGAIHFDEGDWSDALGELMQAWLPDPRPIIIYCADEACGTSKRVAEQLRDDLPEAEIYHLKGGWQP